jgi:hypothetical protein
MCSADALLQFIGGIIIDVIGSCGSDFDEGIVSVT